MSYAVAYGSLCPYRAVGIGHESGGHKPSVGIIGHDTLGGDEPFSAVDYPAYAGELVSQTYLADVLYVHVQGGAPVAHEIIHRRACGMVQHSGGDASVHNSYSVHLPFLGSELYGRGAFIVVSSNVLRIHHAVYVIGVGLAFPVKKLQTALDELG